MKSYIWEEDIARKILVIDDKESSRRWFQMMISSYTQFGYSVVTVGTVKEAGEKLKELGSELVAFLIDQKIGENNEPGMELLSSVTSEYPDIPVVIYTATKDNILQEAKDRGALLYVPMEEMSRSPSIIEVMLSLFGKIRDAKQLRNQFQRIIDALQDEIAVLDPEGKVLMVNKKKKDMFGITDESYYGKECWCIFEDKLCSKLGKRPDQCPVKIVTENPELGQVTSRWHDRFSKDFDDKRINITASPITDKNEKKKVLVVIESVRPLSKIEKLSELIEEIQEYEDKYEEKNSKRLDVTSLMGYGAKKLGGKMEYPRVRMYLSEFVNEDWQMICKACSGMPNDLNKNEIRWRVRDMPKLDEQVIIRRWAEENLNAQAKDNLKKIVNPTSTLVARLQIHGNLEGEIAIDYGPEGTSESNKEFDDDDKYILSVFSRYFAGKIEHIWHEENLSELDKIDKLLVSATGQDSIMDSIVNKTFELFNPENCLIRVEVNGVYSVKKAVIEGEESNTGHSIIPACVGICGRAISERKAQFVVDARADHGFIKFNDYMVKKQDSQWMGRVEKIRSVAIGVLLHVDEVIGTITLEYYNKKDFSSKERQLFRRLCNKAAIALFRTEELSKAIQNTGQIIGMIGSALGHEVQTLSSAFGLIIGHLQNFIKGKVGIGISEVDLNNLWELNVKLWDTIELIRNLPERRDINDICKTVIDIFSGTLGKRYINIEFNLDERIPEIKSIEKAVSIIFTLLNLVSNSSDAMKDSPKAPRTLKISTLYEPENWRVILKVEDNGEGIPESVRSRIFEPGFSTKGHSGMGLYLIRILMENLGGRIEFKIEEKEYTVFEVFIPWEEVSSNEE